MIIDGVLFSTLEVGFADDPEAAIGDKTQIDRLKPTAATR